MSARSFMRKIWRSSDGTENFEKMHLKKLIVGIIAVTIILTLVSSYLAISNMRHMKNIVRDQFNEEQLIIARMAAHSIEKAIDNIFSDLSILNVLPAFQYAAKDYYETITAMALPMFQKSIITEIARIDQNGQKILVIDINKGLRFEDKGSEPKDPAVYFSYAKDPSNKGKTPYLTTHTIKLNNHDEVAMDIILPSYEEASDINHPYPSKKFCGYLKATVNITTLVRSTVLNLKSGKTGYAWVIDNNGTFIYHPEPDFIGKSAFMARSMRNPTMSFVAINEIQQQNMLNGQEGTGTYVSGWHREIVKPMEKLIAYTPIKIDSPEGKKYWSVAVVAPVDEIEGLVSLIYKRQMILQGFVVVVIMLAGFFVIIYEFRWLSILDVEIAKKTENIRNYALELEKSEAKYRSLVESAEDLIFTVDPQGTIRTSNQYMQKLLNMTSTDITGKSIEIIFTKDRIKTQMDFLGRLKVQKEAIRTEEVVNVNERKYWFHFQYIPIEGSDNNEPLILVIGRDITEWKTIETQLINTEKLASLGTLAAGVAHEINNPLGIILGFCELLLERFEPGTIEYNDIKTIERQGLHCKSVVERLLSFARFTEEMEEFCDVNENVMAIVSVVNHTLEMNDIRLEYILAEKLPPAKFDPRGLQQVILNLISNAIHAMADKDQKVITLTTRQGEKEYVEIIISDTGCGIPEHIQSRIFDPFFTTKKVGEGTGLGLSVSYGIVTHFGGTIECESIHEDENPQRSGTTFKISIPVYRHTPTEEDIA